jgi:hypothetical protein
MLSVRIEGHEVETTPAALARLVFDGQVDRHSPVKPPAGVAEQPLEQFLEAPHCEALTGELHRRLRRLCSLDSSAVDLQELCLQVERLCQWRWPNLPSAARFFWTAAWLNELADRAKSAMDFYDAFLLLPAPEPTLRLLALNNRGVLRIRLGRLDGVEDLARAGIVDGGVPFGVPPSGGKDPSDPGKRGTPDHPQSSGLPDACFNLLNLIQVSFGAPALLRAVDGELTDFFSRLPADLRAWWLDGSDTADGGFSFGVPPLGGKDESDPRKRETPNQPQSIVPSILQDPTCRRLQALVTRLAEQARELTADPGPSVFHRLRLWDCRLDGDSRVEGVPPSNRGPACPEPAEREARDTGVADRVGPEERHRYAEAASLLLADDIPSALTKPDDPLTRAQRAAQEELAQIESHLAAGRYELALSRLQVQRKVLASLRGAGGAAALLARVDAQIERIAQRQAQEEQLEIQKTCTGFVAQVDQFCTRDDERQAQTMLEDLTQRLQQCRARLSPQTSPEAIALLDALASRCRQHVHDLRRAQIARTLAEPLRRLRENRPSEGTIPVPPSVYEALAQCRRHDPAGWIEDWTALQEQLDAQQGRYYTHRALDTLRSDPGSWEQVQEDLVQALSCAPDSWLAVAPLFGLTDSDFGVPFGVPPLGGKDPSDPRRRGTPNHPQFTLDHAGRLLERVLRQRGDQAGKCLRLWQCVETTLAPVLAGQDVEAMAEAGGLAKTCLDHWPAGLAQTPGRADPRHPVNRLLEACDKARRLVEVQRLLEARPPRLEQAKEHLIDILRSGLDTRGQLQRAVTGLYLAQFHEEDPPAVQRQVLAGLEEWVQAVPQESVPHMREQEIVKETEKVRVAAL